MLLKQNEWKSLSHCSCIHYAYQKRSEVKSIKWSDFDSERDQGLLATDSTAQHSTAQHDFRLKLKRPKNEVHQTAKWVWSEKKKVDHAQQFDGRASERAANLSRAYTFYCPRNYGPPSQQKLLLAVNFEKQPWIICKGREIDRLSTYVFLWRIEMESFVIYAKIAHFSP